MKLKISQSEDFFDLFEYELSDDAKILHINYRNEKHIVHLRKFKMNFENLPPELWLLSDQDVMDLFKEKFMAYHLNFFKNLERLCKLGEIKLPLTGFSLSEIDRYESENRSFDEYIASLYQGNT